jgi:GTP-binding protein HflX
MAKLRKQLKELEKTRVIQRQAREQSGIATVALAGYTNAGKSSLLNALTGSGVLVQDELFATLDPTVRKMRLASGRELTLADTVGFVRHLPHDLVEAFRSTLTEVQHADLIIHVVDGAEEDPFGQISAVREVLGEIGAQAIPELIVVNKTDIADPVNLASLATQFPGCVMVSANTGVGIPALLNVIEDRLPHHNVHVHVSIPYSRGDVLARIHQFGENVSVKHGELGSLVEADVPEYLAAELGASIYLVGNTASPS